MNLNQLDLKMITQFFSKHPIKLIRYLKLKKFMADQKPLFKAPYDIKDVGVLFAIVAFVLIIAAILGNNLFGVFQESVNFG